MQIRLIGAALFLAAWGLGAFPAGRAAVVVIANRTDQPVRFTVKPAESKAKEYTLSGADLVSISFARSAALSFASGSSTRLMPLTPNSAYYFASVPNGLSLQQLLVGGEPDRRGAADPAPAPPKAPEKLVIPIKVLVDDDEPTARRVWEERVRKRLQAASDLIEKHCRARFEVVAVETWESDNKLTDFKALHEDFERKVKPGPARLAVGFTSQLPHPQGGFNHLGTTRCVLHTHILIREWYPRSEPERLEVLVHELGHFLGASHSGESESVMRPRLADGKALASNFHVRFDPLGTLAMCLVAEEMHLRGARTVRELSPGVREQLVRIYGEAGRALPDDPAAAEMIRQMQLTPLPEGKAGAPVASGKLAESARQVVAAVRQEAERNHRLPARGSGGAGGPFRLTGDELTEAYVRAAATAARKLPEPHAVPAFLLGIGVAVDTSDVLRKNPATRGLIAAVESEEERRRRLEVLGLPTMRGRHDLAQHFVVSCALTALLGPTLAEAAGLLKEQRDMEPGGSGFSFADLCADLAGITFAKSLREAGSVPAEVAALFTVARYMPDPAGLREGLSQEAFARAYGSVSDERFQAEHLAVLKRVLALPAYRTDPK
jgi:hypothetical protein